MSKLATLGTKRPINRKQFIVDTYLRISDLYNSILLNYIKMLTEVDAEICKRIFRVILKIEDKEISINTVPRMAALP